MFFGCQGEVGSVGGGSVLSPIRSFFGGKPVLSVHHIKEDIQAIHMLMQRGDLERRGEKGKCAIERRWKERGGEVEGGRGLH